MFRNRHFLSIDFHNSRRFHGKWLNARAALIGKREEAAKKHAIKVLSAWASVLDHLIFYIIEAPSQPAVEDYFKEIGFAFWNNIEI
jgi:hypothetical protein